MTSPPAAVALAKPAEGFTAREARQAGRLTLVVGIVSGFFVLELAGALVADSIALQADALHLLTDVLALGTSLLAMHLAVRRPTPRLTFGLRRAEPVAAIVTAFLLLGSTGLIVVEAVESLRGGTPPKTGIMLLVASMALLVNGLSAWLLKDVIGHGHSDGSHDLHDSRGQEGHSEHNHDAAQHRAAGRHAGHGHALNLRGAWLHLAGDTLGALAAIVAALVIQAGGSTSADPVASLVVAAILVFGALRLARDAALVLLEAAPPHLPVAVVRDFILAFPGVLSIHDLHVWTLGAGHDAITAHVSTGSEDPTLGRRLSDRIRTELGPEYVTVQVEVIRST
ncbi:MAG TPA: cation diffusion facilitator family transporter [Polyangiaceae bacterium]|nr:cation diffusion facilitator family transporter [Polyangiaceae bacterium]